MREAALGRYKRALTSTAGGSKKSSVPVIVQRWSRQVLWDVGEAIEQPSESPDRGSLVGKGGGKFRGTGLKVCFIQVQFGLFFRHPSGKVL